MAAVFDRLRSVIVMSFVFCLLVCFFLPIFILKVKMTVRCEKGFQWASLSPEKANVISNDQHSRWSWEQNTSAILYTKSHLHM